MARTKQRGIQPLLPLSRVAGRRQDGIDSVRAERRTMDTGRRALGVLMEAQRYWNNMARFRQERERNKRYCYGDQWQDLVQVDGQWMSEEKYIMKQGSVPLKNNLIRRLVRNVLGVYRSQSKEPTCSARDREEQQQSETMSIVLQCNRQQNRMSELEARTVEELLIGGLIAHKKWYGWRDGKLDCWTNYVQPDNLILDCNMRDFRGWDASLVGEIHDVDFGTVLEQFAEKPGDYERLSQIYGMVGDRRALTGLFAEFGFGQQADMDFFVPTDPSRCRVIEIWRKETKPRYRCHDMLGGEVFKIDTEDYASEVEAENARRLQQAAEIGMPREEVPLIRAEWFVDNYWYYYYLTPSGDILREGETPYAHGSHPYVFKAYPFIDGEIHSFVADIIDQQRYVNRLITLYDWIMRSSAKGVLIFPEECLGDQSLEEIADEWTRFNGVIAIKAKPGVPMPQQIATNATNIGISDLLNMQLKFFEDISGVSGALQGKPGAAGTSGALYQQQTQNSTTSLLDLLDTFSAFVAEGAYKDVKNIQQFYDTKRMFNIAGAAARMVEYDPRKVQDIEFDLAISESTATPAYRQLANDFLMQIWRAGQITLEQLLENGDFPFADRLLQSVKAQGEQLMQQSQQPTAAA